MDSKTIHGLNHSEQRRIPTMDDSDSDDDFYDALAAGDADALNGQTQDMRQQAEVDEEFSPQKVVDDLLQPETDGASRESVRDGGKSADDFLKRTKAEVLGKLRIEDSSSSESEDDDCRVHQHRTWDETQSPQDSAINNEEEEEEKGKENNEDEDDNGGFVSDEEGMKEREEQMTEEDKMAKRDEAQIHKTRGNDLFNSGEFADGVYAYSQALQLCPLCYKKDRSIMYANRGACKVKQERFESAITDCSKALELNPVYFKVVLRRAKTYELTDKLEDALKDYERALELDAGCYEARAACMRLPEQIQERNEKLKTEMMSKLKELGNLCLRPFGLSTDNFQLNKDPDSGSYSVNFSQNTGAHAGGSNGK